MTQKKATQNPVVLLARALWMWLRGRVRVGLAPEDTGLVDQQERFVPFRKVAVHRPDTDRAGPAVIFQVRFRFRNLSPRANRLLSLIPIPLIIAQPGFRSKTWLLGQTSGDFIGRYEFDSVADANAYWSSLPLRMMRRRAAPGTLTKNIEPVTPRPALDQRAPAPIVAAIPAPTSRAACDGGARGDAGSAGR